MKRKGNLFDELISYNNLGLAIDTVNKTHRWVGGHHPNKKVMFIEVTREERIKELRKIIINGFVQKSTKCKKRYDRNAGKWRDIHEPALWPDQYVHHALIQVLQPVMMRGMDYWCCGSIKGRGTQHGIKALKKWMRQYKNTTRYCAELDIRHFYDTLQPSVVMDRMKSLVKDHRILDLCERILCDGVQIGAYTSQWFANTTLQPMDQLIRKFDVHYVRYMDNLMIFSNRKKTLRKVMKQIGKWLTTKGMELKGNWQIFPTKNRLPNAMGYKYGRGYTLMRKRALLTMRREIAKYQKRRKRRLPITTGMAYGILSRVGRLRHCNSSKIYKMYVPNGIQKYLKNIIREYQKGELTEWNTLLEQYKKERAAA